MSGKWLLFFYLIRKLGWRVFLARPYTFGIFQGLTVRMEGKKVVVARILIDSIIDRQGLLRTGDVILQANGKTIKDPEQLQTAIEESGEFVVFKIQPSDINQKEIDSALPKAGKVAKVVF